MERKKVVGVGGGRKREGERRRVKWIPDVNPHPHID